MGELQASKFFFGDKYSRHCNTEEKKRPEPTGISNVPENIQLKCGCNGKTTGLGIKTWVLNCFVNVLSSFFLTSSNKKITLLFVV